jgi:hypothetical protein
MFIWEILIILKDQYNSIKLFTLNFKVMTQFQMYWSVASIVLFLFFAFLPYIYGVRAIKIYPEGVKEKYRERAIEKIRWSIRFSIFWWAIFAIYGFSLIIKETNVFEFLLSYSMEFSFSCFLTSLLIYLSTRGIANRNQERENKENSVCRPMPDDISSLMFLISCVLFVFSTIYSVYNAVIN